MDTFPHLQTERLVLREMQPRDAAGFFEIRSDPGSVKYTGVPLYTEMAQAEEYVSRVADGWKSGESYTWVLSWRAGTPAAGQEPLAVADIDPGLLLEEEPDAQGAADAGGEMLGSICLWNPSPDRSSYSIGYEMRPAFRGQGLMSEAVAAVERFAFWQLGLQRILADPRVENVASHKILTRAGYEQKGEKQEEDGMHTLLELSAPGNVGKPANALLWE